MGILKKKGFWMVCVIAIIVYLVIFGNPFSNDPKAEATTATKPAYPERGYARSIVYVNDKPKGCSKYPDDPNITDTVKLTSGDGTVTVNGLHVKSEWTIDSVTVTFGGETTFVSGYVIGSDATEPFSTPELKPNETLGGISLDTKDFSESGHFQNIVLCGWGR